MAYLIFVTHMPLIRMQRDDDFPIAGGFLTKLPWQQFDALTQGAFTDWQHKYEQTDPVFFWYQEDVDLPFVHAGSVPGMEEIKVSPTGYCAMLPDLGYGIVTAFLDSFVDKLWAALALATPCGLAAPPRSSLTFLLPAGEHHFEFGDRKAGGARIQGDADMELVFLADGAGIPLTDAVLERAAGLLGTARAALGDEEVAPVLRQLLGSADVTLTPIEQMLLAVTATENLLFPDVTTGSGDTFARRLSNLLGHDDDHRRMLEQAARDLYRDRNTVIHADAQRAGPGATAAEVAAQLLAGSIEAVTLARAAGMDMGALRHRLDVGGADAVPEDRLPLAEPLGRAGTSRLGPRRSWFAGTWSSSGSLSPPEGTLVSWSPLVGLRYPGEFLQHPALGVHLGALDAPAIVGMEEKDIRRDFIAKVQLGEPSAALAVVARHAGSVVDEEHVLPLTRVRDLAVTGLRLAGFDAFIDPSLLGWYVYDGNLRHRRETVLRQSILMALESAPPVQLADDPLDAVLDAWSLLARYEHEARHPHIDGVLDLYRRVHDRRFLDPVTRAALACICLETILGGFKSSTKKFRLEALVAALDGVPAPAAAWFQDEGRAFRNAVAHGQWRAAPIAPPEWWVRDHEPLAHLLAIMTEAIRELLATWLDADPPVRSHHGPQRLLARVLGRRIG